MANYNSRISLMLLIGRQNNHRRIKQKQKENKKTNIYFPEGMFTKTNTSQKLNKSFLILLKSKKQFRVPSWRFTKEIRFPEARCWALSDSWGILKLVSGKWEIQNHLLPREMLSNIRQLWSHSQFSNLQRDLFLKLHNFSSSVPLLVSQSPAPLPFSLRKKIDK